MGHAWGKPELHSPQVKPQPGVVVRACNPTTGGWEWEDQKFILSLSSKFRDSLGYMRTPQTTKTKLDKIWIYSARMSDTPTIPHEEVLVPHSSACFGWFVCVYMYVGGCLSFKILFFTCLHVCVPCV